MGVLCINSKGKLIIFALILCVFISLSAVSAADNSTDDVISISNSNQNVEIQQTAVESTSVENTTSNDEAVTVSANGENTSNESNDENVILTDEDLKEMGIVLKEPLLGVSIGDEDLLGDSWTYSWGTDTLSWNYVSVHLTSNLHTSTHGSLRSISESPGYFKIGSKKSTTSYAGVEIKNGQGYWTWNLYMNDAGLTPGQEYTITYFCHMNYKNDKSQSWDVHNGQDAPTSTVTIPLISTTSTCSASGTSYEYGSNSPVTLSGTVGGIVSKFASSKTVKIYRDNSYYTSVSTDNSGSWSFKIPTTSANAGSHSYYAYYEQSTYYYASASSTITVTTNAGTPAITLERTNVSSEYPGKQKVKVTVKNQKGDALSNVQVKGVGSSLNVNGVTAADGTVTFTVDNLTVGTYNDWVFSTSPIKSGNIVNYIATSKQLPSFTISKATPNFAPYFDKNYIEYWDDVTIIGDIAKAGDHYATGTVTVSDGERTGSYYLKESDEGHFEVTLRNLNVGNNKEFTVQYDGDDYYKDSIKKIYQTVNPRPVNVTLYRATPYNSMYGDKITVTGKVIYPTTASKPVGTVSVTVGGVKGTGTLDENSEFTLDIIGAQPGSYTQGVEVYYSPVGDNNYKSGEPQTLSFDKINIIKYRPTITASLTNGAYYFNGHVTVNGSVQGLVGDQYYKPKGFVYLYMDGDDTNIVGKYELNGVEDTYTINVNALTVGEHYFDVYYEGDDYYLNNIISTDKFTVASVPVDFKIEPANGYYNGSGPSASVLVNVTPRYGGVPPIGYIEVSLPDGSRKWTQELVNGSARVGITKLGVGTYEGLIVSYVSQNPNYDDTVSDQTTGFIIYQGNPNFLIDAPSIGYGQDGYIYIRIQNDATGIVTVSGLGAETLEFNITEGNKTFKVVAPQAGSYNLTGEYSGDQNYTSASADTMFYIERPGAHIGIDVSDIMYGKDAEIEFSIYSSSAMTDIATKARGSIQVFGLNNDSGYEVEIINGKGYLSVSNLTIGAYNIVAVYSGDNDLQGSVAVKKFYVNGLKSDVIITLNASSINVGDDLLVTVNVDETLNDPIYLYIDGNKYGVIVAEDGKAVFTVSGLKSGNHVLNASYLQNDAFQGNSNSTNVSVSKMDVDYDIELVADNQRNIMFTINVQDDVSGTIKIIGESRKYTLAIEDGLAELIIPSSGGVFEFNITYAGDDKYNPFNTTRTIDTTKVSNYDMGIVNTPASYNLPIDINVTLPTIFDGKTIKLTFEGKTYTQTLNNGVASFKDITVKSTGSALAVAEFEGTTEYFGRIVNKTIEINPAEFDLEIVTPEIIYVGDNIVINVTVPSGVKKVNISVNGKTEEVDVSKGYVINDIDEGEYYVTASFAGDISYAYEVNSTSFNVIKKDTIVDINIDAKKHGEKTIIEITLDENISGLLLVDVDGNQYLYANLTTNVVRIEDAGFESGSHVLHAKYIGDRKFNANSSQAEFFIDKNYDYDINVSLNEQRIINGSTVPVIAGSDLVFSVDVPGDATGKLTIKISNDTDTVFIKELTLPTNLAITTIPNPGLYKLEVIYSGNDDYNKSSRVFNLNVTPSNIISKVDFNTTRPIYLVNDSSVLGVTGNIVNTPIKVYIDGTYVNDVTLDSTGNGTIILPGLSAGKHTVSLTFEGNDEYTVLNALTTIDVEKHDSSVKVDIENVDKIRVGDNVLINVEASGNGTVTLVVLGTNYARNYTVNLKNGKAQVLTYNDMLNGRYSVDVIYSGDDYYSGSTNDTFFFVRAKMASELEFDIPTILANESSVIGMEANFNEGELKVYIDGKLQDQKALIENHVGNIYLPALNEGIHTLMVVYDGDDEFNNVTKVFDINVKYHDSNIKVSVDKSKIFVDDVAIIKIELPEGATGVVLITAGNDKYHLEVTDVISYYSIPNLANGTYEVNAKYLGNGVYASSNDTVIIEVYKVSDYLIDVVSSPIVNDSSDVTVTLPEDAKGTVSIRVNNKTFTGKLLGGQTVIKVTGLLDGDNNFTVYYPGDDKYTDSEYSGVISVDGTHIETSLVVSASEIYVGDDGVITVTLPRDATGVVSINIGGKNYAIILNNGVGTLSIPNLAYGTYNVTATYNGDSKYSAVSNKTVFKVIKKLPVMDIVAGDVDAGANNKVTVSVPVDATGAIIINVNGTEYVAEIKNGVAEFNVVTTISGVYNVVATYNGDAKYLNNTFTTTFAAAKVNSTIDVVIPNAEIGKNVTITVNTPSDATGTVTITVNGKEFTTSVNNGKAVFSVLVGLFDDYTVDVKYSGDAKYNEASTAGVISTFKANTTISVVANDVYVGDNAVVDVTLANDASGSVTIFINGKKYVVPVNDGVVSLPVSKLSEGDYEVNVIYSGDAKYNGIEGDTTFKVSKHETPIDVNVSDISVNDAAVIVVSVPDDIAGSLTINVDGTDYSKEINNGQATLTINDLPAGEHTVTVTYGGNDKYVMNTTSAVFNVDKLASELSVIVNDINVGAKAAVTVTVPAGATGTVTVTVNGKNYTETIDNDKAEFTIDAIDVSGNYPVVASYSGDDKYVGNSTTVEFAVSKYVLAPTVSSTVIGDDNKANITVGNLSDASGNVIISVGSANYSAPIDGAKAVVEVSGLVNEANDIVISYAGDSKYESFVNNAQVTRDGKVKLAPSIIVLADEGVADKPIKVLVILPADATGKVTITVNGKDYETTDIAHGIATFSDVIIPVSGEFSVNASYSGNDKYLTAANSTTTNIDKVNSTIRVDDIAIKVGENAVIKVVLPADANGTVTITVNGKTETIDVVAGEPVELSVSDLESGNYDVDVTYSGNGKYNANSTTATITVDKNALDIKVDVSNIDAGEKASISVTVPSDVTGTVVVSVNGKNYKLTPSNGVASVKVANLGAGEYTVVASYAGDDKYAAGSDNASFKVNGLNTELDISVDGDVVARGDVVITVGVDKTDATGTITIKFNGAELTSDIVDGKAVFNTTLGIAGQHDLTAIYSGDAKYNSVEKTQVIDVAKLTPTITVDAEDIKYGEMAVVVNLPGDVTGSVKLTIGSEFEDTANVVGGKATFEIFDLPIGSKVLNIAYSGDDYYGELNDDTNSFEVTHAMFTPTINAHLNVDGTKSDMKIYVPHDLTGTLDVIVGNKEFNGLTIDEDEGTAVILASQLAGVEGNEFTIKHAGDAKYEPVEYSGVITGEGSKLNATINIVAENTVIGENATISVTVPYEATGSVTIKVNGKEYTKEIVKGKVVFSVLADVAGEVNVDASYDGDSFFLESSNSTTFNVAKLTTAVDIDAKDIKVGEDAVITVTVNDQATGSVTITVGGKDYTENVDNGVAKFTVSNLTGGVKEITAKYNGDSKYGENTTSISINVTRETVTPVVDANLTDDGNKSEIVIDMPEDATGNVTVNVGNKTFEVPIVDGKVIIPKDNLTDADGNNITVMYPGDDKYGPMNITGNITEDGTKLNPTISVEAGDVVAGENAVIIVNVMDNAQGSVTITVDSKNYTKDVVDGKAVFDDIVINKFGDYEVIATFNGDSRYYAATNKTTFHVNKTNADIKIDVKIKVNVNTGSGVLGDNNLNTPLSFSAVPKLNAVRPLSVPVLNAVAEDGDVDVAGNDGVVAAPVNAAPADEVLKAPVNIDDIVDNHEITLGDNVTVSVTLPDDATGSLTISVDGNNVYENTSVAGGEIAYTIDDLTLGEHTIVVYYSGDDKYNENTTSVIVTVKKKTVEIGVSVEKSVVNSNETQKITVTLPENTKGTLTVTVGDDIFIRNIDGERFVTFEEGGLDAGNYNVTVEYELDDDTYEIATANASYEVICVDPKLDVSITENLKVDDTIVITVTLPKDASGEVHLWLTYPNGTVEKDGKDVVNGKVTFEYPASQAGDYKIEIQYDGDAKYNKATFEDSVNVAKLNTTIGVSVDEDNVITVSVLDDVTGTITINVGGKDYTETIDGGKAVFDIGELAAKTYTVDVSYSGDDRYNVNSTSAEITILKLNTTIEASDASGKVDEKIIVKVTLNKDTVGVVTITVDGTSYVGTISNGVADVEITGLANGTYDADVVYDGSDRFNGNSTKITVEVFKVESSLTITASDNIVAGNNVTITVTAPKDATGDITITVDGKDYTNATNNGVAVFSVPVTKSGPLTVKASYSGDDKYIKSDKTETFTASKMNSTIEATDAKINVGEDVVITVTLPEDATGTVTVNVNGQDYSTTTIEKGVAKVTIPNLDADEYVAAVSYSGDDKYNGNSTAVSIVVEKLNATLNILPKDITVGQKESITVSVPVDATGKITVTVDGKNYILTPVNGKATVNIRDLAAGEYDVSAVFAGDDNYASVSNVSSFKVSKLDNPISIDVGDIKAGEDAVITVSVDSGATGNITISVDGKEYTNVTEYGVATFTVSGLGNGSYVVDAKYLEDDKYLGNSTQKSFACEKQNIVPNVTAKLDDEGNKSEIEIQMPEGATGNVTVTVGNKTFDVPIGPDGKVVIPKDNLTDADGNNFTVSYPGDDNYAPFNITGDITKDGAKINATLVVSAEDSVVGETTNITVTLPEDATGEVEVFVNDDSIGKKDLVGGKAVFTTDKLDKAGDASVKAVYTGSDKYAVVENTTKFNVAKAASTIDMDAGDIKVGKTATITVTVPKEIGEVTLNVNGTDYTNTTENGVAVFNVDGLKAGNYTVVVSHVESANYLANSNSTVFNVLKLDVPANVTAELDNDGNKSEIEIQMPEGATGNVTVTVGNKTFEVPIGPDGKVVIPKDNLTDADGNNFTVSYPGDDNYAPFNITGDITKDGAKINATLIVSAEDGVAGDKTTVTVKLPSDVKGTVKIVVNNKEYAPTSINDGIAVFDDVSIDTIGDVEVKASFTGDDKYYGVENSTTFLAVGKDTPITAESTSPVYLGQEITIIAELPDSAVGSVVLKDEDGNVIATNDSVGGEATFKFEATVGGEHTYTVEYAGSSIHLANSTTVVVTVNKKQLDPISAEASQNPINSNESQIITVTFPEEVNGTVTVTVGNDSYIVNVDNANSVDVTLNPLDAGDYTANVLFESDNYDDVTTTVGFTVEAIDPEISITAPDSVSAGENATIVVNLPEDATGNVTLNVNGTEYNATVENGKAVFSVPVGEAGLYYVNATYLGDGKYNAVKSQSGFEAVSSYVDVVAENVTIKVGEDALVTVTLPKDATGDVIFVVNGQNYINNTIVDGVATYSIPNLAYGNYTVDITYSGDKKYALNTTSCDIEVVKNDVAFDPTTSPIFVGDDAVISVVLPDDATGTVTVTIGDDNYIGRVTGGITNVTVPGLANRTYNAVVVYSGDGKYNANTSSVDIAVSKISDYNMVIENEDSIVAGESTELTITLPEDVNGEITVRVNGKEQKVNVKDGKATVVVDNVVKGENTVEVSYPGDDKYNPLTNSSKFNADAVPADISLAKDVIPAGENLVIELPDDATGTVTVSSGGQSMTVPVKDGKAVIPTKNLPAGKYPVEITYNGDDKYAAVSIEDTVYLQSDNYSLNVVANDIFIGEDGIITVNLPNDASGIVFVTVDGVEYNASINYGVANVVVPGLALGEHSVSVKYPGDKTYTSKSNSTTFNVVKYDPEISLDKNTVKKGENLVITLPDDATGTVTATIGGKTISAPVKDGKAIISTKDVPAGAYPAKFTYSGDGKYNARDLSQNVKVQTDDYSIVVSAKDINVGDKATVTVTLPGDATGSVSIVVGGKTYTAPINNGKATLDVSGLTKGTYTVSVTYAGNDKYLSKSNSTSFNVKALDPSIAVADDSVKQGEDLVVELPKDATGTVTATIGGKTISVPVKDGKALIPTKDIAPGKYPAKLSYSGDSKYNAKDVTANVNVEAKTIDDYSIVVSAKDINAGEKATITVTLPGDATGSVSIVVGGKTYTAPINNGKATLDVSGLAKGTYTVTASYPGNDKYSAKSNTTSFNVKALDPSVKIADDTVKQGGNLVVELPKDATGTVTATIGGKTFTAPVKDGKAVIPIKGVPVGTYDAKVTYSGDDKYGPKEVSDKVTVMDLNIEVPDVTKYYHGSERLVVTIKDFDGNPVVNKSVSFSINGRDYTRNTDANGSASIALGLNSGVYNATVVVDKMTFNPVVTILPSVNGTDVFKVYKNGTQYFATFRDSQGNYLPDGTVVTFNINGVMYERKISGNFGLARLNINLIEGKYIITAINPVTGEKAANNVTVFSRIIENRDITKYYRNATQYTAKIIGDDGKAVGAGVEVTFNINGVFYTRTTDASGVVKLNLNLGPGDYIITAEYAGCKVSNKVKVLPTLSARDISMRYRDGTKFVASVLDGQGKPYAGQTVQFNVNGVFYNRVSDANGQAILNINLPVGKYIITSSYNGINVANTITISG
ncbi:adhesin-like protein [Methanobrevibacter millerae]|uniref:Adhesin-like protein n=1 Tax=Methanobrevibacter millerae TaxID=230361 RepID=A0A0U3E4T3_9EURY|nr:adhesin-like protein [Methanobrevibacter millerae]